MLPEKSSFQSPASISIPATAWAKGTSEIAAPMAIACLIRAFINSLRFGFSSSLLTLKTGVDRTLAAWRSCLQELYQRRHGRGFAGGKRPSSEAHGHIRPLGIQRIHATRALPGVQPRFMKSVALAQTPHFRETLRPRPPKCPAREPHMSHSVLD